MAKAFGDSAGGAIKNKVEYFKFENGENRFRMVGEILPRYVYWKKLQTNTIPVECLAFDREQERFTNIEKDWFNHFFPKKDNGDDNYPSWAYSIQVIDLKDNKIKMMGLKKKMFTQIQELASKEAYGDPTDVSTGWTCVVTRKKTGSAAFNVEYNLDVLECEVLALTEEQLDLVSKMKSIDELLPRPSAEEQKAFIEKAWFGDDESVAEDDPVLEGF